MAMTSKGALQMLGWLKSVAIGVMLGLVFGLLIGQVRARDLGQWDEVSTPEMRKWYKSLMQPDNPAVPCCGEADAYWADEIHVRDGHTYATITDDRPDEPLHRPHVPVGTEIEIPNEKIKYNDGNPTGHTVVFLASSSHYVYCFVMNGGA